MKKVLMLLAALALSACGGAIRNSVPTVVYDFGSPVARLVEAGAWSKMALEVRSPSWSDSPNIDYRLAYDEPLARREYAGSRWAGTAGSLIAQRLRQQLGVMSVGANTATDCLLRVELQEFAQVFASPLSSRGVLLASVSVIDPKRHLVAERQVVIEKAAATADAQGGVRALVAASTELGTLLADWLAGLKKNGSLGSCH